jgi:hypothetical protein
MKNIGISQEKRTINTNRDHFPCQLQKMTLGTMCKALSITDSQAMALALLGKCAILLLPHAYHFGLKRTGALPDEETHPFFPKWYFLDPSLYIEVYNTCVCKIFTRRVK